MSCAICGIRKGVIIINKIYKTKSCRKCQVNIMNQNIAYHKLEIIKLKNSNNSNLAWHQERLIEYKEKGIRAN